MTADSKALLAAYRGGDSAAAQALFDRYTSRLLALARSRLSSRLARRVDADDIVQSTYRSFFWHARQGTYAADEPGDLWRLLATITLRKVRRQAKRHRAARRSLDREVSGGTDTAARLSQWADPEPSPAHVVAVVEETLWLMSQFDPIQRQALEMRLQSATIDEIAAALNRSERTIRRWLAEARELLAERGLVKRPAATEPISPPREPDGVARLDYADYRLDSLIGSGGMCKVYAAVHKTTGERVAIKVLRKRLRSRPQMMARFWQEAEIASRFMHPNIVPIHGLGRLPDGGSFMVMQFVAGANLAEHCRAGRLPVRETLRIVAAVAGAIQHAHEQGVVHRDLKPENVLIDLDGRVLVTDFGFAWLRDAADGSGAIVGTEGFMAPEQLDPRQGTIGPHTDVFGLGALLHALLFGHPPELRPCESRSTTSENPCEVVLDDATIAEIPQRVRRICGKCLAADWKQRYSTAREVATELLAAADGL